jgi:hypothetical protein
MAGKDWPAIRTCSLQLIDAVAHMHSKGVIHGDLKPNVSDLMDPYRSYFLLFFGCAL